jgi:hypothetical protein
MEHGLSPETFCIPCITFEFQPCYASWLVVQKQYPLQLAYATTFNSAQGLILDCTILDLQIDVFAHRQLYTAVSQVWLCHDVKVLLESGKDIATHKVGNIVYPQLLLQRNGA